ncbi:unnamed protein product [Adineta ricciae]|uniref:Uncharacterized protein n=1 Tax=Adineta ricciae TaxID=249248 RepID=A0A814P7P0_ADIRI|nr:unnamed protein product [Adineta ricciae]CAF1101939.1 unnamed protein product [Adineta ricciae]
MARATVGSTAAEMKTFTDCMFFMNGSCKLNDKCRYRHCAKAAAQTKTCSKWPKICRDARCSYRHPAPPKVVDGNKKKLASEPAARSVPTPLASSQPQQEILISFFWDIENVPIPKGQKPFDIVQRIRQKLIIEAGLREDNFSCFCDSAMISKDNQLSLLHANVSIVHVPDRKSGAVDRQIMLALDRFERAHRPPATIVLISGDIDFVGKLSDLRHQAGFHVIVIHNKPAKEELKATVNAHYPWELFTQALSKDVNLLPNLMEELTTRTPQPYRMASSNRDGHLHTVEPSPNRPVASAKSRPTPAKKQTYPCPKCSSEFDSIQAVRQHQEAKDHLFDCPRCDETFTTLDGLTQHKKAKDHQDIDYGCGQCNRRFNQLDSLNQHQKATGHSDLFKSVPVISDGLPRDKTPPRNNSTTSNVWEDAATVIISQGIAALVKHYPAVFANKK